MFKKILITTLSTVIVGAVGTSAYNAAVTPKPETEIANIPAPSSEIITPNMAADAVVEETDSEPLDQNQWQGNQGQDTQWQGSQEQGTQELNNQGQGNQWQGSQEQSTQELNNQGQGNQGNGRGGNGKGGNGNRGANQGSSTNADPQNGMVEWVTLHGTVSNYTVPYFTLTSDMGQTLTAQLGDLGFVEEIGFSLQDGDSVIITGYWDASSGFAVGTITLDETGQSFTLRDELGRPLWSGGRTN